MTTVTEEDLFYTRRFVENGLLDEEPTSHLPDRQIFKRNGDNNRKRKSTSMRKRQKQIVKRKRLTISQFVDDEAEVSDDCENNDYDSDVDSNDSELNDFIDEETSFDDNNLSFYRQQMTLDTEIDSSDVETEGEEPEVEEEKECTEEKGEDHDQRYKSIHELPTDDYRHQKYSSPQLTVEQKEIVDKRMKLLTRKGVFPYETLSSFDKLNDRSLPAQSKFFSSLTGKHITNEDYAHANAVWDEFCDGKTLNDYMDLYLCSDILLLTDIFIKFRKMCLHVHKLDPLHSYTLPGFSWQAALKYTGVELELLTDPEMHLFFENAIRGGISVAIKRQAVANIPHMEGYDKDLPTRHIIDLDANNLYGRAMSQLLPTRDFKWASKEYCETTTEERILSKSDTDEIGEDIEGDFIIPHELHDYFNEYPPLAETMEIKNEMMSDFQNSLLQSMDLQNRLAAGVTVNDNSVKPKRRSTKKLTPNLYNKVRYVANYRLLKYFFSLGVKLVKVHRIVLYKQENWLGKFIDLNTQERAKSPLKFYQDLFKLINNAVYGKTMENVRRRRRIDYVDTSKKAQKLAAKPTFKSFSIIREDLLAIERAKMVVHLNKPIYTGFAVLELSKLHMYQFHYRYAFPKALFFHKTLLIKIITKYTMRWIYY